jgi:Glycosyltransferase family 29 (sialyltransferase)
MEKLKLVLPEIPPYVTHQFGRCAVVGNSGDLLKTNFGEEIDKFDVVIRENGAPIQVFSFISGMLLLQITQTIYYHLQLGPCIINVQGTAVYID